MSRLEDFQNALPRVTFNGEDRDSPVHRDRIAQMLAGTNIPVEHAANLSAIHTGIPVAGGAHAQYGHLTNSIRMAGDPERIASMPGVYNKLIRTTVHEIGHAYNRNLNPGEFNEKNLTNPSWRGRQEAFAENYADEHMPGSHSGYDYDVAHGHQAFDANEYRRGRGPRYGNIDPRLLNFG